MPAKIRKHQTNLICSGLAVIAFGFWSIVRALLFIVFNREQLKALAAGQIPSEELIISLDTVMLISYILVFIFLLIELSLRLYIGRASISVGNGKHKSRKYIVLSVLFLVYSVFCLYISFSNEEPVLNRISAVIIETSSNIAFIEVIYSSLAIRRYSRSGAEQGGAYAA